MIAYDPLKELPEKDRKVLTDICGALKQAEKIAVSAHIRPDGDAIGSGLALLEMLRQMGKDAHFCNADMAPFPMTHLPYYDSIENRQIYPEQFDLLILLEGATPCRCGQNGIENYFTINIDHHATSTQSATLNWVDPGAAAVAELIYMLGKQLSIRFTSSMGFNLFAAIISDTGSFKYSNTTFRTLFIAADLVKSCGFDPTTVTDLIFNSNPLEKIHMLQKVLSTLQIHLDGQVAIIHYLRSFMENLLIEDFDSEDVVAIVRSIYGVNMTLFFKEVEDRQFRVSIRSRGQANAQLIASHFDGGGHQHAAGYNFQGSLEQAMETALKTISIKLEL